MVCSMTFCSMMQHDPAPTVLQRHSNVSVSKFLLLWKFAVFGHQSVGRFV